MHTKVHGLTCDELRKMTKLFPQRNENKSWKRLSHNMIFEPNTKHGTWHKAEAMTTQLWCFTFEVMDIHYPHLPFATLTNIGRKMLNEMKQKFQLFYPESSLHSDVYNTVTWNILLY